MKKGLITILVLGVLALNTMAFLRSHQSEGLQAKPADAKPVRKPLTEVSFVLLPNLVKV